MTDEPRRTYVIATPLPPDGHYVFWQKHEKFVPEYPDATEFTDKQEAITAYVKLCDRNRRFKRDAVVIADYGLTTEQLIA